MNWKHSDALALAKQGCTQCDGRGFLPTDPDAPMRERVYEDNGTPCKCVYRNVFRACMARFERCVKSSPSSNVRLEMVSRAQNSRQIFGRKNEEYIADFTLIARRALAGMPIETDVLRFHFLLGADWRLCCRRLNISRGNFFHAVRRVELVLGKAFRETRPYPIFPLDEYFGGSTGSNEPTKATVIPIRRTPRMIVPLRKAV